MEKKVMISNCSTKVRNKNKNNGSSFTSSPSAPQHMLNFAVATNVNVTNTVHHDMSSSATATSATTQPSPSRSYLCVKEEVRYNKNAKRKKANMNHSQYRHHRHRRNLLRQGQQMHQSMTLMMALVITFLNCKCHTVDAASFTLSSSSRTEPFLLQQYQHQHHRHHREKPLGVRQLYATRTRSKSPSSPEETIQAVQPMTTSSKEKRRSVQRAWEQAQLLDLENENLPSLNIPIDSDDDSSSSSSQASILDESISATPFLDLFADAGIASVKKVSSKSASGSGKSLSSFKNMKPRGRPASVPGAMSRSTLMGMHEMQSRVAEKNRSMNKSRKSQISKNKRKKRNLDLDRIYNEGTTLTTAISSSRLGSKSSSGASRTTKSRATKKSSTSILKDISKKTKKKGGTGRGRGRPRKDKGNNASVDEITSIAATSAFSSSSASSLPKTANSKSDSKSKSSKNGKISKGEKSDIENKNDKVSSSATTTTTRSKRGELKTLRPKSKKMKDSEKEGESTGMMQQISGKFSKGGKDGEPPNLQKYYRTELLTPEEEYTLGTKIQFMIKCEQVHEGLYEKLGHYPSIVEWANACGYKEEDPNKDDKNYMQSEYANQIRPLKTDTFDPVEDANMFVGNGLVNASGPGRGRGRAKKPPPAELKDYYDDSDIKFDDDYKQKLKHLKPLNQGTPMQFVDFMVVAKQAKQRMVQCNMRLVVSISKRYKHVGVNIADLVQEGSIGLTRAAEKFDPKKGFKFSTYASWWIQQAVFRSIAYHSRTIRLPVHVHNLLNRTRRVRLELQRILGRAPTNEEMANELDMSIEKYNKMIRLTRKAISLDMAKYQNNPKDIGQESETSLGDTIDVTKVIRDENSPEQSVDRVLFRDDLKEMLKILGDDERAVIYARYGIEDGLSRTVTTVAAKMGQSKSWVRSQECRALRKLRRPWYEKRLWEHQNSLPGMI